MDKPATAASCHTRLTVACFLANAVSLGVILSFSSQQQLYIIDETQSVSALRFVWVPCLQWTMLHASTLLPATFWRPGLLDIAGGSVLCVFARIAASQAQSYASKLLLEGLLTGAAFAMICVPLTRLTAVAARLPPEESENQRQLREAVSSSGAIAGAVFWSAIKQALPGAAGVEWMHRVVAIVSAALLTAVSALVWSCSIDSLLPATLNNTTPTTPKTRPRNTLLWRLAALPVVFCIYAGIAVIPLFLTSFVFDRGMGESASTMVQVVFYLCGAIGHCVCALAECQLPSEYVLVAVSVLSGVFGLAMPVALQPAVVFVYFALLGLLFGSMLARPPSHFTTFLCEKDERAAIAASCAGFIFGAVLCGCVQDYTDRGWLAGGYVSAGAYVSAGGLLLGSVGLVILLGVEPQQPKGEPHQSPPSRLP